MNVKLNKLVVAALASTSLMGFGGLAHADSTNDIVNALVMKGVLTEEEGALLTKGHSGETGAAKKEKDTTVHASSKMAIRGYLQVRNTALLGGENSNKGINLWSDRSVGNVYSMADKDKNFIIRRARVIISGSAGDRLDYYIQPDFASSASTTNNVAQLRDYYGDLNITKDKVHRIRVGQSKVPYGFENLQSSQNRLALDRADAFNSAVRDERDLGAFYYYTPDNVQKLFKEIQDGGLKHSGNYGMFALGAYNGQGANQQDQNSNYHTVARLTYPWKTESGQIYEAGIQGYTGKYVRSTSAYRRDVTQTDGSTYATTPENGCAAAGCKDERVGISFMMYPMPFGLQGEWNWGKTPGLDTSLGANVDVSSASGAQNFSKGKIVNKNLNGGYIQTMYKIDHVKIGDTDGTVIPFVRWQYFDGFSKAEANAPQNKINDWELGAEWQIAPEVEFVAYYHHMNRSNLVTGSTSSTTNPSGNADYARFKADAIRMQLQYNF
ncbi:Phosphate-selective porin O/P [Methylophilaceae bacterium]